MNRALLLILVMAGVTMLTRFLPFLLFGPGKPTPPFLRYLGRVLPQALIAMLVVYCLKDTQLKASPHGIPEALALLFVACVQGKTGNAIASILGGTALYMVLIRLL